MKDAITDSGLTEEQVSNPRTGLIAGSGGASTLNQMEALDILREKASSVLARTRYADHGQHRFRLPGHL